MPPWQDRRHDPELVGRRLEVEKLLTELPVRAYFFHCLRIDERSLADGPLRECRPRRVDRARDWCKPSTALHRGEASGSRLAGRTVGATA
ncbi:MAG: hypothetical protein KGL45_16625 [Gammaproteobacteria bacterium]|nr:hypothetical protein [Gammaproteobacteria bacterium]MDE2264149.1 hypothetical protein [Gammaproteobacteria bacterium]